jgi:phosphonate transport system substrate-binding protein
MVSARKICQASGASLLLLCICSGLSLFILGSCSETVYGPPDTNPVEKTLSIGLIPERNIFEQMKRYDPLAEYLSKKIGVRVSMHVLTRYGNIVSNFNSMKLDGAFFGSFTYTLAHARLGVSPVARPVNIDGSSSYYGLIFTRKDSGISTTRDMKGKIFAFVDRATTAGYLLPLAFFRAHGITDYTSYFKETYYTGTHDDAIYDVLNGRADVGAAKNTVFYRVADSDPRILTELEIITKSPEVPENGLALKKDVDPELRSRLKSALLTMHENREGADVLTQFRSRKFIETSDADYEGVYDMVKFINLDLATYDYLND